jgi:sulfoxide reductase heme-binding subunit YedZ
MRGIAGGIKLLAHLMCALPLGWLAVRVQRADLGADPVAILTHETGFWALRLLLACLAVTPMRRITGWNALARYRRMLGLWAFAYACAHLAIYLLDMRGFLGEILRDIARRPYITMGFTAWVVMVPLALTSTQGMMRRLGRQWQRVHRLVYVAGIAACLHFLWLVKMGKAPARLEPLIYLGIVIVLLMARVFWSWQRRRRAAQTT